MATFGLGTWQVFRRQWKLDLIDNLTKRTSALPEPLPQEYKQSMSVFLIANPFPVHSLEELDDMEYRKFELTGTFDHDKEIFIGPRSLLGAEKKETGGLLSSGQTGFLVITPFKLSNSE